MQCKKVATKILFELHIQRQDTTQQKTKDANNNDRHQETGEGTKAKDA